jgi:hypothetical protein
MLSWQGLCLKSGRGYRAENARLILHFWELQDLANRSLPPPKSGLPYFLGGGGGRVSPVTWVQMWLPQKTQDWSCISGNCKILQIGHYPPPKSGFRSFLAELSMFTLGMVVFPLFSVFYEFDRFFLSSRPWIWLLESIKYFISLIMVSMHMFILLKVRTYECAYVWMSVRMNVRTYECAYV